MENYKLVPEFAGAKVVKRMSDGGYIPFDPANTDYQEYLRWLEAGNTPLPAEENKQ
jgi:hypothetical protein